MEHKEMIPGYNWSPADLARAIVDLKYNKTTEILTAIAQCLAEDAHADLERNREKLSQALSQASKDQQKAAESMKSVWYICEPHM